MLFQIPNVLSREVLTDWCDRLQQASFSDGKLTAGWHAKAVKTNEQLAANHEIGQQIKTVVRDALLHHP